MSLSDAWSEVDRLMGGFDETLYCQECGMEAEAFEATWDYAGTHCTHGRPGTYRSGVYLSKCCDGDLDTTPPKGMGDCDICGEWSSDLDGGACEPCRNTRNIQEAPK